MKKILVILLAFSLLANAFLWSRFKGNRQESSEVKKVDYPFLARRIFAENPNDIIVNFVPLRRELSEYIASQPEKIGVSFEYLPTGLGIGINDRESFFRASLVKVPGVMSAYKLIEEGKLSKDEQLTLEEYHLDSTYGTLWQRGTGATLSVEEAITFTLVESDNTAYEVLNERINGILLADIGKEQNIDDVYDYLDIPRDNEGLTQEITPRNYSSILPSLFFSAYLTYEDSNEVLEILTQTTYDKGISRPLPDDVKVAHKFGIHNIESEEKFAVHSDCGIVYLPLRPYILCVMVASGNQESTSQYMQDISQKIFNFVKAANTAK